MVKKVREKGKRIIRGHLFPLFSRIGNELFALFFLFYTFTMCILSLRTFVLFCSANGTNCTPLNYDLPLPTNYAIIPSEHPIEYVRFVISAVSLAFALLNAIVSMRHCYTFKQLKCLLCCKSQCCPCRVCKKPHRDDSKQDADPRKKLCMSRLKTFWVKYMNDLFRLYVIEVLLCPTLICGILENAGSHTYEGTPFEKFVFARFIFSCASNVWNVASYISFV